MANPKEKELLKRTGTERLIKDISKMANSKDRKKIFMGVSKVANYTFSPSQKSCFQDALVKMFQTRVNMHLVVI